MFSLCLDLNPHNPPTGTQEPLKAKVPGTLLKLPPQEEDKRVALNVSGQLAQNLRTRLEEQ